MRLIKSTFAASSLLASCLLSACDHRDDTYWRAHPAEAFTAITERQLPPGVRAVALRTAVTDNLYHTSYVWLLEGSGADLRKVLDGTGFGRSDDDARGYIPSATDMFDISGNDAEMLEGYEWERDRDSWYLVLKGEKRAIYVH